MSLLVTFALEQEFAPWGRARRFELAPMSGERCHRASVGGLPVFVTFTGIGARRLDHLASLAGISKARAAIVTGLAGGLNPVWGSGEVLAAEAVCDESGTGSVSSDPSLLRLAAAAGAKIVPRFVTVAEIVRSAQEKSRLSRNGDAVEMESLKVMKEFARLGIPAVALRAISDSALTDLPCDFGQAVDAKGDFRMSSLMGELASRPWNLPGAVRFGMAGRRAAHNLARSLERLAESCAGQFCSSEKPALAVTE